MALIDDSLPGFDLLDLNELQRSNSRQDGPQQDKPQRNSLLLNTWHTIPEFKQTLMSMLTPSQLTTFLAAIGYIMTDAERYRFMSIERQIFKSTVDIDRYMKQGYSLVLVGSRLHRIWDLIRHRHRTDGYLPISATTAKDRARLQKLGKEQPQEVINVWLIITHPKHLEKNKDNLTITRSSNCPIPLLGTWCFPFRGLMQPVIERANDEEKETLHGTYLKTNRSTKAVTGYEREDHEGAASNYVFPEPFCWTSGCWNICHDIAEEGVNISHYVIYTADRDDTDEIPILATDQIHQGWDYHFVQDTPKIPEVVENGVYVSDIRIWYTKLHTPQHRLRCLELTPIEVYSTPGDLQRFTRDPKEEYFASLLLRDYTSASNLHTKIPLL